MKHSLVGFWLVGVGVMLAACGARDERYDEPEVLCFRATAKGLVNIRAEFGCIAGGCTRLVEAQCSVERSANGLTITATAHTETPREFAQSCELDCVEPSPSCGSLALEPGEYTLAYGSPSRRRTGALVVEEDAFAFACVDGSSDGAEATLPPGVECVGRSLDPVRGCFGEPEDVGTMAFDASDATDARPGYVEDPSGTCYRFERRCRPEGWEQNPSCSPADSSAEICDEN